MPRCSYLPLLCSFSRRFLDLFSSIMAFSNTYLTVPDLYPGGRRGSAPCRLSGYHAADGGQWTLPGNGGSSNQPATLPHASSVNPPDSCQNKMDRLAQLLIVLQAKLQINPFQGNTDQLRHLKHHLQNSVTTIDNTIALRTGLMDLDRPAVSKPPSTSTTLTSATKKSDHYRCLFCEPLKKYYGSRGTFKRHVTEKHWPMVEYHCKAPGCLFQSYRKDKALSHNPEALGHVISQTSPACMTVQPDITLPHPPACSICSKAVGTWREWLDCVFCHCQLPEGDAAISIRGGDGNRKDNDSDDDMDNGGFGGGNGNFLNFQNQHSNAMGSQSNGSEIAFSGSQFGANDGYHYAGASHSLYNGPMDMPDQTGILDYLPEMDTIPSTITQPQIGLVPSKEYVTQNTL